MKMYSREDLMNMKNFGDEDAEDEDEDDDEAGFPTKLVPSLIFILIEIMKCLFSETILIEMFYNL